MLDPLDNPDTLLEALIENLAVHRADATAIWEALPKVYQEVTGVPLDRGDLRHIMLCQCVLQRLTEPV